MAFVWQATEHRRIKAQILHVETRDGLREILEPLRTLQCNATHANISANMFVRRESVAPIKWLEIWELKCLSLADWFRSVNQHHLKAVCHTGGVSRLSRTRMAIHLKEDGGRGKSGEQNYIGQVMSCHQQCPEQVWERLWPLLTW